MVDSLLSVLAGSGALLLAKLIQVGLTLALTAIALRAAEMIAARARPHRGIRL